MEVTLFLLEKHIVAYVNWGHIWEPYAVRGEMATCIDRWSDSQWEGYFDYLAKSLGYTSGRELTGKLWIAPNMNLAVDKCSTYLSAVHKCNLAKNIEKYCDRELNMDIRYHSSVWFDFNFHQLKVDGREFILGNLLNQDTSETSNEVSGESIEVVPFIEKENLKRLTIQNGSEKSGTITYRSGAGFRVLVDDIELFVHKKRLYGQALNLKRDIAEGQSVRVINDNRIIKVLISRASTSGFNESGQDDMKLSGTKSYKVMGDVLAAVIERQGKGLSNS
ncbi:hypothetical protein [Ferrimonas balearica]|uniref:hypothetical protein n=1 Tax=Ferrimonas balearica TaxID=44012 RepID=UPI001F3C59F3|nr:hypothetical protein [Ferrimonas balearica]MBY6093961.1 hypothetical protein [Ferrimonas balearica]